MIRVCYGAHASNLTGASRSLLDILANLDRSRIEPVVLAHGEGPLLEALDDIDVEWHIIPHRRLTLKNGDGRSWRDIPKNYLRTKAVARISRFLDKGNFDLLHNNSLLNDPPMQAARNIDLPYICHIRELVKKDHGLRFLNEERTRSLATSSARAIAISDYVASEFKDWFAGNQLVTLRNGVSASQYYIEHQRLFASEKCEILLAGRIAPGKGQKEAILAIEELKRRNRDVRLTIVGGTGFPPSYQRECVSLVQERGLEDYVSILDFHEDLTALKASADISLTCSHHEALGRVTIEGMLSGCLVIGADAGATPEIIDDGATGLLYSVGDPLGLANKIEWATQHPFEANRIAQAGQADALATYDINVYENKLMALYEEVARVKRL